jgi:protein-arginine deiminase
VNVFLVKGASFEVLDTSTPISSADIRAGLELAIEAKDIVRDPAVWDGYVDLSLEMSGGGQKGSDKLRMRVSPVMTYHHLLPTESTWVSQVNAAGNAAMRADLATAATAAGVPAPRTIAVTDQWTQDFFETGFMSMPGAGGTQHAIRVALRSANTDSPNTPRNPLRRAGRAAFAMMRGKDMAAVQQYDLARRGRFDTLNSFGNFETIPPYTANGKSFPLGRQLRGNIASYYTDPSFTKMMEAQAVQPPVYLDTSWLLVGHVDETLSFVKASSPRGWVVLVNDATMARNMLQAQANAGNGSTPMFVGKYWDSQSPAQATINQVLSDTDVMQASAEAAVEVADQIAILKAETGITDAEIVKIPYLHMTTSGKSVAYQPGMVNGLYLSPTHFVAPDPHGPVVNGEDIFQKAMRDALTPYGITVHFAEDWDTYHRNLGEVHCGTNSVRQVPAAKWWESGR